MSTHALKISRPPLIARYLDFVLIAVGLPFFIFLDLPTWGYLVGAGCYVGQRMLSLYLTRKAERSQSVAGRAGYLVGSMIGRGWIVALAIFAVGYFAGRADGLTAAVLFLGAFTVYFITTMILRLDRQVTG